MLPAVWFEKAAAILNGKPIITKIGLTLLHIILRESTYGGLEFTAWEIAIFSFVVDTWNFSNSTLGYAYRWRKLNTFCEEPVKMPLAISSPSEAATEVKEAQRQVPKQFWGKNVTFN